jgi:hypothetical protein
MLSPQVLVGGKHAEELAQPQVTLAPHAAGASTQRNVVPGSNSCRAQKTPGNTHALQSVTVRQVVAGTHSPQHAPFTERT